MFAIYRGVIPGRAFPPFKRRESENPESHFLFDPEKTKWDSGSIFFPLLTQAKRKFSGMTFRVLWLALCVALVFPSAAFATVPTINKPIALLRALDKVTGHVAELKIPVGQPLKFGTLIITVHACMVTPPEAAPEAAAFLKIEEFKPGESEQLAFRGWMFASSPALSAMEDPVYDVWVIGCEDVPGAAKAPVPAPQKPAPQAKPAK